MKIAQPRNGLELTLARIRLMGQLLTMDPAMRVTGRGPQGKPLGTWRHPWPKDPNWAYRTILQNEVVFDVGDHVPWETTAARSEALWCVLDEEGVDYLKGGSGGDGTHTHVFFDGRLSNRERAYIVEYYSQKANEGLGGTGFEEPLADMVASRHRNGKRVIREFGSPKQSRQKTLILNDLSGTRAEVYIGPVTVPIQVPVNGTCAPLKAFRIRKETGQTCPVSDDCWKKVRNGGCNECPNKNK